MTTPLSPEASRRGPDGAPARVLVVADTAADRDALGRDVQREGYVVDSAGGGREALEKLRAEPFDLVLLDAQLPDMDGPEFLRALRGDAELAHLPVVVV